MLRAVTGGAPSISRMANDPRAAAVATTPDILDTPQAGPAAIRGSFLRVTGYVVGILATVLSVVAIVQGVTDSGLAQIGVREYAVRTGEDRDGLLRNLLGMRLALTFA